LKIIKIYEKKPADLGLQPIDQKRIIRRKLRKRKDIKQKSEKILPKPRNSIYQLSVPKIR